MTGKKFLAMLFITMSMFIVAAVGHAEDRKPFTSVHEGTSAYSGDFDDLSLAGGTGKLYGKEVLQPVYSSRIERILSLVRTKSDDPRVLVQIRHKLLAVSDERLRMISSLSDRIIAQTSEAGADVAYLLMATLIILS